MARGKDYSKEKEIARQCCKRFQKNHTNDTRIRLKYKLAKSPKEICENQLEAANDFVDVYKKKVLML